MLTGLRHRGLPHQEIIRTANERHGFESTYAALTTLFKHSVLTNSKGAKDKLNAIDTRNKSISLPPLSPTQASTRVCTLTEAPLSKLPIHMKNVVDNSPDNKTLPAFSRKVSQVSVMLAETAATAVATTESASAIVSTTREENFEDINRICLQTQTTH